MKKIGILLVSFSLVLALILPVLAEEAPSFDLEQIIITASPLDIQQSEGNIVSTKVVKPGKATNVADLLSDLVGVDISRKTAVGDTKDTIKLRGFDSSRFIVAIDGRPMNAGGVVGGYFMDWSTFPLDNVEKIEVIRGPKSAVYGNTIGGVINIITKKGTQEPVTRLQTMFGSNDLQNYLLEHSGSSGNLAYVLTAGKTKTDGYLRNNYLDNKDFSLKTTYTFNNKGELTLGLQSTDSERGFIVENSGGNGYPASTGEILLPATGAPLFKLNPGSHWDKKKTYYNVAYKQPTDDGFWQVQYFKNEEDRREFNYDINGKLILDRKVESDRSWGYSLQQQKQTGKHKLTYGWDEKNFGYGNTYYNYVDPSQLGLGVSFDPSTGLLTGGNSALYGTINDSLRDPRPTQKLKTQGIYIQDEYHVNERLSYLLGLRYDKYAGRHDKSTNDPDLPDINGSGLSPKVGMNYQFNPETIGYLSVSKAYVMPTLPEYYWWYKAQNLPGDGSRINMNKPLEAEEGIAYEIGLKKKLGERTNYRIAAYYNDIDNYIYNNIFYIPGMKKQVHNIDNVKVWGLELDGEHKLSDRLSVFANYTYQKTQTPKNSFVAGITDDEVKNLTELDYHPRHKANIGLRYQTEDKTQIALTARYVGKQKALHIPGASYLNPMGAGQLHLQKLGGYTVANLSITHPFNDDKEVSLFVDNLFNKQYSEVYGYPMQGTTYGFAYKQKF